MQFLSYGTRGVLLFCLGRGHVTAVVKDRGDVGGRLVYVSISGQAAVRRFCR